MTALSDFTDGKPITRERAELATEWLVHHADKIGSARADRDRLEYLIKVAKARAALASRESSAAMKEQDALASGEYLEAIEEHALANAHFETLMATRIAAQAVIETWRSINASQKGARV